jgi:SAM-dependent methyltransferase
MEDETNIEQARRRFDRDLHTDEYRRVHEDPSHLDALMDLLDMRPGGRYLDLGTGNGYLAFEMVRRFPDIGVTGADIARRSIEANRRLQQEQGLRNLDFVAYDGVELPFGDAVFGGVISRYAFHHFPDPAASVRELHRITDAQGFVVLSDPITYEDDTDGFIDRFQRLKPDGHLHFFREPELHALFGRHGFAAEARFLSRISYPRDASDAYLRLLEATSGEIRRRYGVEIRGKTVHAAVTVLNVRYRKA